MNILVKERYDLIWHFYNNSHGICFCKTENESVTEYSVLLSDVTGDFDAIIDDSDCIHLICQNKNGDIIYATHFNGQWRKTSLLKSKSQKPLFKNFTIKRVGNLLNLFYCIDYNGKTMLTHHIIENTSAEPQIIDNIKDDFSVTQDSNGNITVLYFSEIANEWGTKKYIWSQKSWSDFSAIKSLKDVKHPFLYTDINDKIHIVYERSDAVNELFENKEKYLGSGQNPVMFHQIGESAMWEGKNDNKIYIKKSSDISPTVIMPGGFTKPLKFQIRTTKYESELQADCCFGFISDGLFKIYGINNFFAVKKRPVNPVKNESKAENPEYIELQKIKISIAELYNSVETLKEKIKYLDIEKTNHRLDEIETVVNKLTSSKLFKFF